MQFWKWKTPDPDGPDPLRFVIRSEKDYTVSGRATWGVMMSRLLSIVYGLACYAIFFATFLYLIAFVGNLPWVPLTVDSGNPDAVGLAGVLTNIALIALFGVQHSVMARRSFKDSWTKIVSPRIERSTYVLVSSLVLIVLYLFWRPMPQTVWQVENPLLVSVLWAAFGIGWLMVLLSTFLLNHFELFGLSQVTSPAKSEPQKPTFKTPFLYKLVRHPLYTGFLIAFWAIPHMTVGHMVLAVGMSVYIAIGIHYEEKDLVDSFGEEYLSYRSHVGSVIPGIGKRG